MAKKTIVIGIIIGIILGSFGTYYSNYFLSFVGIQEISFPSDQATYDHELTTSIPITLETNELRYTLVEVKESDFGINGEKPLEGGIYLISKIKIENLGKKELIVFGKNWLLKDKDERTYNVKTFDANPETSEKIFSIRIPPGFTVTKNIGFEIPYELKSSREFYVPNGGFESQPILLGKV